MKLGDVDGMQEVSCSDAAGEQFWGWDTAVHDEYSEVPKGMCIFHILPSGPQSHGGVNSELPYHTIGVIHACIPGYEFYIACVGRGIAVFICNVFQA